MNGWAEDAMREAIELLTKSRRNDLASDLHRIFKTINFEDLEIMRSSEADRIADAILEAESIADLTETLKRLARLMKIAHCTVHVVTEGSPGSFTTKVLTTYPEEWITLYVNRRYYFVDPVVQAGKNSTQSFFWDSLDCSGAIVRSFWREAEANGVGSSGFTIPITTEHGDKLALSVCSTDDAATFREKLSYHESDLFNLGVFTAEAFCNLASERRPASFEPTDDQLLVLQAISIGIEEAELENRDYQYGSFATLKRSICLLFRTKTLAQAAVLAAKIGLLENAPLTKADILAASDRPQSDCVVVPPNAVSLRRLVRARTIQQMPGEAEAQAAV